MKSSNTDINRKGMTSFAETPALKGRTKETTVVRVDALSVKAEPVTRTGKLPNVPHAGQRLQTLDKTASLYYEMHSKMLKVAVKSFNIGMDGLKSPLGDANGR